MNYYRSYMSGYAALVTPVAHLARGSKAEVAAREWLQEHQASFEAVKDLLARKLPFQHADPSLAFAMQTDASNVALSAVLTSFEPRKPEEVSADKSKNPRLYDECAVGYYTKLLNEKDARMSQVELEALVAVLACVVFRSWIWG